MDDAERFVNEIERRHAERRRNVERLKQAPRTVAKRIRQFFKKKPNSPEDPYAYVMAPVKPKPPHLRASAAADRRNV
jgi:hypothetical protein